MKPLIAKLLLYSLILVEGRDEFEERREFHDWLCRKRPSLKGCSKPFAMSSYQEERKDHNEKGMAQLKETPARAHIAKSGTRSEHWWSDDGDDGRDDEKYENYLWNKYGRDNLQKVESVSHNPPLQNVYHSNPSYDYRYPTYQQKTGRRKKRQFYYGYPAYGGYGLLSSLLGGGLFNFGVGSGLNIRVPFFGLGITRGFGIGIG